MKENPIACMRSLNVVISPNMFTRKSWEVQPGIGPAIVTDMGEAVREHKKLQGVSAENLKFLAGIYYWSADLLVARRAPEVIELLRMPTAEPFQLQLSSKEYNQRMKAERTLELLGKLEWLEQTQYRGNDHMWRVRIEALESGAVEYCETGAAGGGNKKQSRLLEAGEIVEGKSGNIGAINIAPDLGGEVIFDFPEPQRLLSLRQGIHVTGLVSTETGEPQAELQVLEKTG